MNLQNAALSIYFFFTPWIRHFACSVSILHLAIFSLVFLNLSFLKVCTEVFISVILSFGYPLRSEYKVLKLISYGKPKAVQN
jgi:hypothetical protein